MRSVKTGGQAGVGGIKLVLLCLLFLGRIQLLLSCLEEGMVGGPFFCSLVEKPS
jgi:hypothetical protein